MKRGRGLAYGAAAAALLGLGATALLCAVGDGPAEPKPAIDAPAATAAKLAAPAVDRPPPTPATPPEVAVVPAAATDPSPAPEDVDPSWRSVRIVLRARELGPAAPYVAAGLRNARDEMQHCFAAQAAGAGADAPPDGRVTPAGAAAVLALYLHAREGSIDVVDARVEQLGTWRRELVECCAAVLRGHTMPAHNARPGARYRLRYALE